MRRLLWVLALLVAFSGWGWAGTVGDIDNDDQVGLPEAVYALSVSANMRTPLTVDAPTFDMAAYKTPVGATKFWRYKFIENGSVEESYSVSSFAEETVDGKSVLAENVEAGLYEGDSYYDVISDSGIDYIGYKYKYFDPVGNQFIESYTWYDPPFAVGRRDQALGEKLAGVATYTTNYGAGDLHRIQYREYQIIGVEDVTVPAGTFQNCLKIANKRAYGSSSRFQIHYNCQGIGTVKVMYVNSGSSTRDGVIQELMNVEQPDGSSLSGPSMCYVQGAYTYSGDPGSSRPFSMVYISQPTPIHTTLSEPGMLYLRSDNGADFYPDPAYYPSDPPEISLTISGSSLTGTFVMYPDPNNPSVQDVFNYTGDVTCAGN